MLQSPQEPKNPYLDAAGLPLAVDVLIATGARVGEMLAFRWEDVDLASTPPAMEVTGTIVFRKGAADLATGARSTVRQAKPKSERGVRQFTVPANVAAALAARRAQHPNTSLIFEHKGGYPLATTSFRILCRAAIAGTSLVGKTPHDCRRTAGTVVTNERGSEEGSRQLGNTRAMTERAYAERVRKVDNADLMARFTTPLPDPAQDRAAAVARALADLGDNLGVLELSVSGFRDWFDGADAPATLHVNGHLSAAEETMIIQTAEQILNHPVGLSYDSSSAALRLYDGFSGAIEIANPLW